MCKTYACRIFEQPLELESKGFQQVNWELESFWWPWKAWKGKECTKSTIKTHTKLKKSLTCSVLTSSHPNARQWKFKIFTFFNSNVIYNFHSLQWSLIISNIIELSKLYCTVVRICPLLDNRPQGKDERLQALAISN